MVFGQERRNPLTKHKLRGCAEHIPKNLQSSPPLLLTAPRGAGQPRGYQGSSLWAGLMAFVILQGKHPAPLDASPRHRLFRKKGEFGLGLIQAQNRQQHFLGASWFKKIYTLLCAQIYQHPHTDLGREKNSN